MDRPVNIWSAVVFDLHPRVREVIDGLNNDGQIDHDEHGSPFLIGVEQTGPNVRVSLMRNGKNESLVMNPRRRKAEPVKSWSEDGYRRKSPAKNSIQSDPDRTREREKRVEATESYDWLVEAICRG